MIYTLVTSKILMTEFVLPFSDFERFSFPSSGTLKRADLTKMNDNF